MKDIYKEAMDAVKAPDALVEKTLKLMLEAHQKLEAQSKTEARSITEAQAKTEAQSVAEAHAESRTASRATRTAPKKNNWVMRAALPVAACLCLGLALAVPRLLNRGATTQNAPVEFSYSPSPQSPTPAATAASTATAAVTATSTTTSNATVESIVKARAADNLATRSGPAAKYRETGTYPVKGEAVRLLSRAYDEDGICWVQCEVRSGNELRRVYTGAQRLDAATFDLGGVPEETPLGDPAKAAAASKAMYGPGDGYDTYDALTVEKGQTVTVIAIENEYAQVEWATSVQRYRAWVPVGSLNLL